MVGSDADKLRCRFKTYSEWPGRNNALQLAVAGFVFTGVTDKVECHSCGILLYNWQDDDDPLLVHNKYAPDCQFMRQTFPQIKAPSKPMTTFTAKYPHYSDYETRLRSFDSWPLKCVPQSPEMMARSGFFYTGSGDRARCFHCGVTLRDWGLDDYPSSAHAQWSSSCPFVQQLDVDGMNKEIEALGRTNIPGLESLREAYPGSDTGTRATVMNQGTGDTVPCSDVSKTSPLPCTEDNVQLSQPCSGGNVTTPQPCSEYRMVIPPGAEVAIGIRDPECSSSDCMLYVSCEKCREV
ncbi:death-associated inhibitor of apoptosis 1-like [Haliotis rufescens]|uniref:death-associated inhibitor of apoptosis 1-like n=1 Tax=Haliotis rufescens TaxID=6454 RepID=UPI00201F1533|nr:death-associated inhibitor of apoptosis 1-like [Haliotis rufescens]